ncbi:MAG: efflux RND transporter permease subunit [Spirochaetes bacterium]|nr:efflux RND transporter permease subunit [Spirochaetota bacterium]
MEKIIRYLDKNHLFVTLLLIFIGISSVFSLSQMKRQPYKNVDMMELRITSIYPGASPEDVELNVTFKVEEAIKEIDGIDSYYSKSEENVSTVNVKIDQEVKNPQKVKDDIKSAIDGISDFPKDMEKRPEIFDMVIENVPIIDIGLTYPEENMPVLRENAKALKKMLLELPSVGKIYEHGIRDKEIHILLNKNKLKEKYISFEEVIASIQNNNLRISGGSIESYTEEKGIVTFSEFSDPSQIENIIIRTGEYSANSVKIKDVGQVVVSSEDSSQIYRFSGKPGVALHVTKKGAKDVIRVIDNEIKPLLKKYNEINAPEGMEVIILKDESNETKARLSMVINNAILGFILVLLVLFLFLDKKIAFWTAFGIPVSIAVTFILLRFTDVSINSISLCGFIVVLGMLVDDAIIIAESIFRLNEEGITGIEAAVSGTKQVIIPVVGTVLTTIITFSVMYFIPGMEGQFAAEIPTIVIIMLSASLFEGSILLPVHLAGGKKSEPKKIVMNKSSNPLFNAINVVMFAIAFVVYFPVYLTWQMISRFPGLIAHAPLGFIFRHMERIYSKILLKILKHKYISIISVVVIWGIAMFTGVETAEFEMYPIDQSSEVMLIGKTIGESSLDFTSKQTVEIEKIIKSFPEKNAIKSYVTEVGTYENDGKRYNGSNVFGITINLIPSNLRKARATDVKEYLSKHLAGLSEIEEFYFIISGGGPPAGRPVEVEIMGNDNIRRKEIADEIKSSLAAMGVVDIDTTDKKGKPEIRLLPKYQEIAKSMTSVSSISNTIRTAIDGLIVSYHTTADEKIPFRVKLDEKSKDFNNPLKDLYVRNNLGKLVDVNELVNQTKSYASQNIYHYNGERTTTISGDLVKITPVELNAKLKEKYSNFEKDYPGFKLVIGGEAERSGGVVGTLIFMIIIAFIAIYFILVIQFKSFFQPAIIISAVPFGIAGILLAFSFHKIEISMMAMIGILGFVGVVVNDSIVMVDYINTEFKEISGYTFTEKIGIIAQGAKLRLRPIFLTTVTTCAGLFPSAYGLLGSTDIFISGMVFAMFWGLITGTLSALFIVPLIYLQVEEVIAYFRRMLVKL